mmetsp:Transcript_29390/g.75206  ORF Transcript_29390/g.75206 Transcript_29390/m.75206 type:complete len:388 (+) Transcript_29390:31-1194(+)
MSEVDDDLGDLSPRDLNRYKRYPYEQKPWVSPAVLIKGREPTWNKIGAGPKKRIPPYVEVKMAKEASYISSRPGPIANRLRALGVANCRPSEASTVKDYGPNMHNVPCGLYEGEYDDEGRRSGAGSLWLLDGSRFEGNWAANQRCGPGTLYGPVRTIDNQLSSAGSLRYLYRVTGNWAEDRLNGGGAYYDAEGHKYIGQFKDSAMHGKGTYTWPDGSTYSGAWEGNEMHGEGILLFKCGGGHEGRWDRGQICGEGISVQADGKVYSGAWEDGRMNGIGTVKLSDGSRHTAGWEKGRLCPGIGPERLRTAELHGTPRRHPAVKREGSMGVELYRKWRREQNRPAPALPGNLLVDQEILLGGKAVRPPAYERGDRGRLRAASGMPAHMR